jgi:hypothetical protein
MNLGLHGDGDGNGDGDGDGDGGDPRQFLALGRPFDIMHQIV